MTLGQMNDLAYEDIILSTDQKTKKGNVTFKLVKNCKRKPHFSKRNCCLEWDRLVAKYESHRIPSYLNLKNRFENSALASID